MEPDSISRSLESPYMRQFQEIDTDYRCQSLNRLADSCFDRSALDLKVIVR